MSFGHDYYFAFAEVEYEEMNSSIEATIRISTHDFEKTLRDKKLITKELSLIEQDSAILVILEKEIESHFWINPGSSNGRNLDLHLDGFEILKTGVVEFYLSANVQDPVKQFEVGFDILMDELPLQQNKLTFINRNKKMNYVFLPNKRTQIIALH